MHTLPESAVLLRIFIGESDKLKGKPLYETIVEEARRQQLAGATVLRGIMGYGVNSRIHTFKLFALSEDMPLIIEIVDTWEKLSAFLPIVEAFADQSQTGILITKENLTIIRYTGKSGKSVDF